MQIEITGETERMIQAALATGKYASVEEYINLMAKNQQPKADAVEFPEMPKHIDVDALATMQGVGPIVDFRDLEASFWPEGASVDKFANDIRLLREQSSPRTR